MSKQWTLLDAQQAVDAWISQWEEGYFSPLSNLARLTEEVGELAREINLHHGEKPPKTNAAQDDALSEKARIQEEMGDILFVLVCLANSLDIDLDEALKRVLQKYDVRDARRFTPKS